MCVVSLYLKDFQSVFFSEDYERRHKKMLICKCECQRKLTVNYHDFSSKKSFLVPKEWVVLGRAHTKVNCNKDLMIIALSWAKEEPSYLTMAERLLQADCHTRNNEETFEQVASRWHCRCPP